MTENQSIIKEIIDEGCFRVGEFMLKSGKVSPFYIDLRRLVSNPDLQYRVAGLYADLLKEIDFARIAGIPMAAIPITTCISLQMKKPMIYPRLDKKGHGSGNIIEGVYKEGEKVVMVDDLITTGKSKFEAVEILRNAGLVVTDLVVLLERGMNVREELSEMGITLHSYYHVNDFVEAAFSMGLVTREYRAEILRFVKEG
ncbi:MAG: orotate phosphoribosyltransferase [Spirochaetales bacterium]|nr:orotate phosphoribosyltransferase [Spirochaetales bacterium]